MGGSHLFNLDQANIEPCLLIDEMSKGFLLLGAEGADIQDPETYVIRKMNPFFKRMFDIHNNYIDKPMSRLSTLSDSLASVMRNTMIFAESGTHELYLDEFDRWFLLSIFQPAELNIALISEDITEKKKIEEKLAESEETMRLTLDVAGEGLWQWRVEDELVHHNKQWNKIMGYDIGSKTHALSDFMNSVHPEDQEEVYRSTQRVFSHLETYSGEHRVITLDGRTIWIEDRGIPIVSSDGKLERVIGSVTDITRYKETQEQLHLEKEILQSTLLSVGDAIITTDQYGLVRMMNPAAERALGYTQDELYGRSFTETYKFIDPVTRERYVEDPYEELHNNEQIGENIQAEIEVCRTGKEMHIYFNITPIKLPDGEKVGYIIVFSDISPVIERQKRIEYLSFHDELTGLYNRRYLMDSMNRLDSDRNLPFTIMVLDLNNLKGVNDSFGHASGDLLIQKTAEFLESIFRQSDIIARTGGDEFCVLLPRTREETASGIVDRIKNLSKTYDSGSDQISVSVGYAVKTKSGEDIIDVMRKADANMYKDKELSRNY